MLESETRITQKWKLELERTSAAYERIIGQMQVDLKNSTLENEHWRREVHRAAVISQKKRRVVVAAQE